MLKVLELFGGIGAPRKALERLGINIEVVDYVEIDKYAVASYNAIYNENFETQDICKWNKDIEADLIFHGSPCQDFSIAGKQAGADEGSGTRSSLMYETLRIVEKINPKYVIWENVKNVLSKKHIHNFEKYLATLEQLGYNNYYQVLNAKDYGIPQNRERLFTISIRKNIDNNNFMFPQKQELKLKLKDLLENNVEDKYFLSDKQMKQIVKSHNQEVFFIKNNTKKRFLEAIEGDSVNLEHLNSKTRRGRVGKQVAQTLTTSCNQGVVVEVGDSIMLSYPNTSKNRIKKEMVRCITTQADLQGVFVD